MFNELKFALRFLARTKGLAATVILTLALGIGANAAIFSVVRGVLLRPLVNRDESRLIYVRQSAPGFNNENSTPRAANCARFTPQSSPNIPRAIRRAAASASTPSASAIRSPRARERCCSSCSPPRLSSS
jgi:hypothetical protein